jgi:hypothetical protein
MRFYDNFYSLCGPIGSNGRKGHPNIHHRPAIHPHRSHRSSVSSACSSTNNHQASNTSIQTSSNQMSETTIGGERSNGAANRSVSISTDKLCDDTTSLNSNSNSNTNNESKEDLAAGTNGSLRSNFRCQNGSISSNNSTSLVSPNPVSYFFFK